MITEFIVKNYTIPLYCRSFGHGPALLLIHGSCVDSDFFFEASQYLSEHFTVFLYDRRGYTRSGQDLSGNYSISAQVEDALAILEEIKTPCYLAAHSAGCSIAVELLSAHPDMFQKALLFEPVFQTCIPQESPFHKNFTYIDTLRAQNRNAKAIAQFLEIIGPNDKRAPQYTSKQLNCIAKNSMHFMKNEYTTFLSYTPDFSFLSVDKIVIGLSEGSHQKVFGYVAKNLAETLDCQLLAFPGTHNAPHDLPLEFSYLLTGIFNKHT